VHRLLTEASETRDWVVVFVRGLADDVKQTLKVNHDRGTLNVVPVVVDFDLAGLNTLNDIAMVTGCSLVSSNMGDLISSVRLDSLPLVERLIVQDKRIVIRNASASGRVRAHLADLRRRRSEASLDDLGQLLDRRIRSLTSNHVILRLPNDRSFVVASQAVDYALRGLRSSVDHGVAVTPSGPAPAMSLAAGHLCSARCLAALRALGCVISLREP